MVVNRWIITGWRGSGKTTFCQALNQEARQKGWDVAGLLSPARFQEGLKNFIDAVDIRTGEKRSLATVQRHSETDLAFGDWFFNPQTLEWGNQVLQGSIPCDLLTIDELGPLEFKLSLGWVHALEVIQSARFRLALVVIRPELLELAHEIIQPTHTIHIERADEVETKIRHYALLLDRLKESL
jgi:nucleoside-triphosphatase THEP1